MNTNTDSSKISRDASSVPNPNDSEETQILKQTQEEFATLGLEAKKKSDEELISIKNRNEFGGKLVARIAIFTPLIILLVLLIQLINPCNVFGTMEPIPQAIFISASFLSFIVIYTMLIKGLLGQQNEKESSLPIKELEYIMRELRELRKLLPPNFP